MSEDSSADTTTLPSWREGATRNAIIDFVKRVSGAGPDGVPVEDRVAVFDNDGTLWTEKPMPTQLHYVVLQWAAAAKADPSLAEKQPYKSGGNSNGDIPMLDYVQGNPVSLSLLVHHDDDTGRGDAPYDKGAETAIASAAERNYTVVSVKDDWNTVFPDGHA